MKTLILIFFFLHFGLFQSKAQETHSFINEEFKINCIDEKSCLDSAIQLRDNNQYQEADLYFQKGLSIAEENKNFDILPNFLFQYGKSCKQASEYEKAIDLFSQFLDRFKKSNPTLLPLVYSEISKVHQYSGNLELAYENQLKSLNIFEASNDSIHIMKGIYEIGSIFFFQKNYELALKKYEETLSIAKQLKNDRFQYNALGAIGGTYSRLDQIEISTKYNLQALELAKEINYNVGLAYSSHNIGYNYYSVEKYDSALVYFQLSYDMQQESNDLIGQAGNLEFLGNTYLELGENKKGIELLNQSLELSKKIQSKPRILESYSSLAYAYSKIKDFKKSNDYLYSYIDLNDSLVNETTMENMKEVKTKYEVQQKEIELAQKEIELARKNFELNRIYTWVLAIGLVLLSLLVWLIFKGYRTQKRNNELLELKNKEIQINNHKLAANNEQLKSFAFIASHDLKEPLRTIGSYASLVKRRYKNKLDAEANEFLEFITDGVGKMYNLLNDVLRYSKVDDEKEEEMKIVNIEEVVKLAIENVHDESVYKNVNINYTNLPKVIGREYRLTEVFQNLISNGVKYNNAEFKTIQISSYKENNEYIFEVKDNGIGIENEYQNQIFGVFKRLHGKYDYSGTGVGLATCKKIIEQEGGKIWVNSEPGKGSTFLFSLPFSNQN